jgi:hypothetical protein
MSSSFITSNRLTPTLSNPPPRHRRNSHQITRPSSLKCHLSSSSCSDDNHNNDSSNSNSSLFKTLSVTLAVSAAASGLYLTDSLPNFSGGGGPSSGGNGGGGGGGGDGGGWFNGDNGSFWSRILSPSRAIADEPKSKDWDSHELPANITVATSKLSGFKKYKVSDIYFLDRNTRRRIGAEDSFLDMVSLKPGGIYTKAQLQKELESLASCGMFEKVDMDAKTKPDGTLALSISFAESMWERADKFRCINVGLMAQTKPIEMDADMTDKEKLEVFRRQEREYKRRIDKSRPCLLAPQVYDEIMEMLNQQGRVTARLLQRIRDRVQKWYHDEGYACAQVVNFGNLNTREVVCEVVEGDITQMNVQFLDKLGNVVEGNTEYAVVSRELPRQVCISVYVCNSVC